MNILADPNPIFDPTLPSVIGKEAAKDALVMADVPNNQLIDRFEKKPQEIGSNCLFENAEIMLWFYEDDIVLHVIRHEVKNKCVYELLQHGEDDTSGPTDMSHTRSTRSSYLGKDPFDDEISTTDLEPEQSVLLHNLLYKTAVTPTHT